MVLIAFVNFGSWISLGESKISCLKTAPVFLASYDHFFSLLVCFYSLLVLILIEFSCFKAHVRGHQVRKQYKSIIWSVGILEKVILRWRRKGSGLRGFKPDPPVNKEPIQQIEPCKEDDYDFLKEGRKQSEERFQKALSRVKSMVQYPEARAQYRRLLNVVEDFRQTKVFSYHLEGV